MHSSCIVLRYVVMVQTLKSTAAGQLTKHLMQSLQTDLAAVLHLVDALNAWQAESQLASASQQAESDMEIAPVQMSLLLECSMTVELQHISQVTAAIPAVCPYTCHHCCHQAKV